MCSMTRLARRSRYGPFRVHKVGSSGGLVLQLRLSTVIGSALVREVMDKWKCIGMAPCWQPGT